MDPWLTRFTLWFIFLKLGFISRDRPFSFAWNAAVMSGLGLLISAWWVDKLKKQACRAVGPALTACFEPLVHYWNATSLSLFLQLFIWKLFIWTGWNCCSCKFQLEVYSVFLQLFFFFSVIIFRCCEDVFGSTSFPFTTRLWNSLPDECFSLSDDLNDFKSKVNGHLLS